MNQHWTVDELTDRLYGIRESDQHLQSCRECSRHLEALDRRRAAMASAPEISRAQLRAQRNAILERIDAPSQYILKWIPAATAAVVCFLGVAVFAHWPARSLPGHGDSAVAATTDAQLFSDIYNVEEAAEPRAAAPIHELFQEEQP